MKIWWRPYRWRTTLGTRHAAGLGEVGERFLKQQRPSLEAQVANLADEIAYNNHDVDDGLRSGLVTLEQLASVKLFADHLDVVRKDYPALAGRRLVHETIRRMINTLSTDLLRETEKNLREHAVKDITGVRAAPPLAAFSAEIYEQQRELKSFLL